MHVIQIDFNKMAINFLINITRQGQVVHVVKSSTTVLRLILKKWTFKLDQAGKLKSLTDVLYTSKVHSGSDQMSILNVSTS